MELVAEISRLFDEEHNKNRKRATENQSDAEDSKGE